MGRPWFLRSVALVAAVIGTAGALAAPASATPFTSPDGLWTWARPLPHGYPASSISAPAPGTLFATTSETDVMATLDGGANWAWSHSSAVPGLADIKGVQFVSAGEGWLWGADASGLNGMVLHTTNGGGTWQSDLALPNMTPLLVRFSSSSSGWVVAADTGSAGVEYTLFTSDGGQTWSAPAALPYDAAIDAVYSSFAALAPRAGKSAVLMETVAGPGDDLIGTVVWRTSDGGATWAAPKLLEGAYVVDADFSSSSVGCALQGSYFVQKATSFVWRTTNGGASWKKVAVPSIHQAALTTTGSNVWVVGTDGILHSSNQGASWRLSRRAAGNLVSFSGPADGWIANSQNGLYLHTENGGKTWQRVTGAPVHGVTALVATPDGAAWAAAGRVIRSADTGRHWRTVTRRFVNCVAAISASRAWAVGPGGLLMHTTDGGHHWTLQDSGVKVKLETVFFLDARHGWAGGAGGLVLRTTDGGRHWSHNRGAILTTIRQVVFGDPRHGIVLGGVARRYMITEDGGRTWAAEHIPAGVWPTVAIMDGTQAIVLAQHRPHCFSFTSSDGGKTWQRAGNLPDGLAYSAIVRSGSLLCAVGGGGNVATSRDDSTTWSSQGVPNGGALSGVGFVGDELLIGGEYGVMTRDLATAPLP